MEGRQVAWSFSASAQDPASPLVHVGRDGLRAICHYGGSVAIPSHPDPCPDHVTQYVLSHQSACPCSRSSTLRLKPLIPLTPRRTSRDRGLLPPNVRLWLSCLASWANPGSVSRGTLRHRGLFCREAGVTQGVCSRPGDILSQGQQQDSAGSGRPHALQWPFTQILGALTLDLGMGGQRAEASGSPGEVMRHPGRFQAVQRLDLSCTSVDWPGTYKGTRLTAALSPWGVTVQPCHFSYSDFCDVGSPACPSVPGPVRKSFRNGKIDNIKLAILTIFQCTAQSTLSFEQRPPPSVSRTLRLGKPRLWPREIPSPHTTAPTPSLAPTVYFLSVNLTSRVDLL